MQCDGSLSISIEGTLPGAKMMLIFVAEPDPYVDFYREVSRVFHRELTRLKVMFLGSDWRQGMADLLLVSGCSG